MFSSCFFLYAGNIEMCPLTGADPGFGNGGGGGGKILSVAHKSVADHPPLRGFPEATIKVYTWIFLGFRIASPPFVFFLWSHYESLYLDLLGFRIAPLVVFFSEATIKVYTWIS